MTKTITDTPMLRRIAEALARTSGSRRTFTPNPATTRAMVESGLSERDAKILQEGHAHEVRAAAEWGATLVRQSITPPRDVLPDAVSRALATFQESEAVGDGRSESSPEPDPITMPKASGWQSEGDGSVYRHAAHGAVRLHGARWTHHAPGGRIAKSGTSQASLNAHLADLALKSSKTLGEVLDHVRGGGDHGPADAHAIAARALGRSVEHGSATAHALVESRLRGAERTTPPEAERVVAAIRRRLTGTTAPAGSDDLHARLRAAIAR